MSRMSQYTHYLIKGGSRTPARVDRCNTTHSKSDSRSPAVTRIKTSHLDRDCGSVHSGQVSPRGTHHGRTNKPMSASLPRSRHSFASTIYPDESASNVSTQAASRNRSINRYPPSQAYHKTPKGEFNVEERDPSNYRSSQQHDIEHRATANHISSPSYDVEDRQPSDYAPFHRNIDLTSQCSRGTHKRTSQSGSDAFTVRGPDRSVCSRTSYSARQPASVSTRRGSHGGNRGGNGFCRHCGCYCGGVCSAAKSSSTASRVSSRSSATMTLRYRD